MRKERGATVIEILIVFAVIGILASIGTPFVLKWRQNVELQGNVRLFAADLQRAKILAVSLNNFVAISFYSKGYKMFVDDGSGGGKVGDYRQNGTEPIVAQRRMSESVLFRHNFSANRLRFAGFGGNKTGTATFRHSNGNQMAVVVSVLGRVRIVDVS